MLYFSVYLRLFLPSLHSLFLQIDHYLLRPNSANLLKNTSQLNLNKIQTDYNFSLAQPFVFCFFMDYYVHISEQICIFAE